MANDNADPDRQIIPRWRGFINTAERKELACLHPRDSNPFSTEDVSALRLEWEFSHSPSVAADLTSVAFTLGHVDLAKDVATFLLRDPDSTPTAKDIAGAYLGQTQVTHAQAPVEEAEFSVDGARCDIGVMRLALVHYPRNPMLWADLSRLYTILGLHRKAFRAIRIALNLAPENRFLLRSAVRMLLHIGEGDRAHQLILNAKAIKVDPWLLSAEIALSDSIHVKSPFLKIAKNVLSLGNCAPTHTSELASAIGTLEAKHGKHRNARSLILQSLVDPTENAVAQAAWVDRHTVGANPPSQFHLSPEAVAWAASANGQWVYAVKATREWQGDEPFSSRPAVHGAFLASRCLQDHHAAVRFAQCGLMSNPNDFLLINNCAFALAQLDRPQEASDLISRIRLDSLDEGLRIVATATLGLIAFRSGDVLRGRDLYLQAISAAEKLKDSEEAVACAYLSLEEARVGNPEAVQFARRAVKSSLITTDAMVTVLIERVKKLIPNV